MSNLTQNNAELLKFDGKPSWGAAFPQAMQHVLAMLIGNITPPMLIAGTCGLSAEEKIMLTQAAMIIGGITTLLQLFPVFGFGMKMPNVMGVAFAYMPILTIIGQQYGIAAIFGSQLVAGFVSIFVGMFIGKIRRFFPPIVSGTVVMSIGLSLYKTAISYIGGGSAAQANGTFGSGKFWFLAILTLIVTLACNFFGKGLVKASGMLIGIVVGYAASLLVGGVVSFADFEAASWFALPRPFYFRAGVPSGRHRHDDPDVHGPGGADHRRRFVHRHRRLRPRVHRPGAGRRHQGPGHLRHDRRRASAACPPTPTARTWA